METTARFAAEEGPGRTKSDFLQRKMGKLAKRTRYVRCLYKTSIGALRHPNIAFIWIPKTAGTSMFGALEKEAGMVKLCRSMPYVRLFRNTGAVTFGHYHYKSLIASGFVSEAFDRKAFKFCISRNPYERALSLYYYLKSTGKTSGEFVDFLNAVHKNRPPVGMYNVLGMSQTNPQVDWIVDADGAFVVDKVYRLEDMDELKNDFSSRFGITLALDHLNHTRRDRSTEDALNAHNEIVPLIEEIYLRDFALLGYQTSHCSRTEPEATTS